jgi:hypothetical protein
MPACKNGIREYLAALYDKDLPSYTTAMRNEANALTVAINEYRIRTEDNDANLETTLQLGNDRSVSYRSLNYLKLSPILVAAAKRAFFVYEGHLGDYRDITALIGDPILITDYLLKYGIAVGYEHISELKDMDDITVFDAFLQPINLLIVAEGARVKYRIEHSISRFSRVFKVEISRCERKPLTKEDWEFIDKTTGTDKEDNQNNQNNRSDKNKQNDQNNRSDPNNQNDREGGN